MGNWPSIRREDRTTPPSSKKTWFCAHADRELLGVDLLGEPRQLLSARAGTLASKSPQRRLELRLLDAQAVGVGGDHAQLAPGRPREDPVSTGRVSSARRSGRRERRLDERLRRDADPRPRPARGTAGSPRRAACGCGRSRCRRSARRPARRRAARATTSRPEQRADDVEEQSRREDGGALALDLGVERDAQPDLHVGGAQLGAVAAGAAICTPDSAWIAPRVEATRVTVWSWASSSSRAADSFTMRTSSGRESL